MFKNIFWEYMVYFCSFLPKIQAGFFFLFFTRYFIKSTKMEQDFEYSTFKFFYEK